MAALTIASLAGLASSALGASATWTGLGADGDWINASNWSSGIPGASNAGNNTDVATFNSVLENRVVNIDANRTILTLSATQTAGAYTFTGGTLRVATTSTGGYSSNILLGDTVNSNVISSQTVNNNIVFGTASSSGGFQNNSLNVGARLTINGNITGRTGAAMTLTSRGAGTTVLNGVISNGTDDSRLNFVRASAFGSPTSQGMTVLNGLNTYTGTTTVTHGTLSFNSIKNVNAVDGGSNPVYSALGRPTTAADGTITVSAGTTGDPLGGLRYTGTGDTTDRIIKLGGNTKGSYIQADGTGALVFTSDNEAIAGIKSLYLQGSSTADNAFNGAIVNSLSVSIGILKRGSGTWVIGGNNTATGSTSLNAGLLKLNYATNNTSKLSDTGTLFMAGGHLQLTGGSHAEVVASTTLNPGYSRLSRAAGSTALIHLNALTRGTGGTLDIATASIATTDTNNATGGTLGGYITIGGADWAVSQTTGSADTPITAYGSYTTWAARTNNTHNLLVDSGSSAAGSTQSVKINTTQAGQSLDFGAGANIYTFANGGMLFVGAHDYEIKGGQIRGGTGAGSRLTLHHYGSGVLNISSQIIDNSTASAFALAGTGTVQLTGANTYTAPTYISGTTVQINTNGSLGAPATGGTVFISDGTLHALDNITLDNGGVNSRGISVAGGGATMSVASGKILTVPGVVSNPSGYNSGLAKSGTGTLVLSATNTYVGDTNVNQGTLRVNGSIATSFLTTVNNGGTLAGSGVIGDVTLKNGGKIAPGNSPGTITTGYTTLNGGGSYLLELQTDGTGTAGADWDRLNVLGTLDITALSTGSPFVLALQTLTGGGSSGPLDTFDSAVAHTWASVITTGGLAGSFASNLFSVDTNAFGNGLAGGSFSLVANTVNSQNYDLVFSPAIPEPGAVGLAMSALIGFTLRRRRA